MKTKAVLVLVAVLAAVGLSQAGTYGGGSGTAEEPYLIFTPEHMNDIGANPSDWASHFRLMADIDMSGYPGGQYNIIGNSAIPFTGSFDGNSHILRNLTYATSDPLIEYVGLFGRISEATIKNFGVENVSWTHTLGCVVGGLVAYQEGYYCHITDCNVTGLVNTAGQTPDCSAGGLVGVNKGWISNCCASVNINGTDNVGGLVGTNEINGFIQFSYSTGAVSGVTNVGGLIGNSRSYCRNSYATGAITGTTNVGGLAGSHSGPGLYYCYTIGLVSGVTNPGGVIGNNSGAMRSCIGNMETCGQPRGVGSGNTGGLFGGTTAQMKTLSFYQQFYGDWDFSTTDGNAAQWRLPAGEYPRHIWELYQPYSGSGTEGDPYQIWTARQMNSIAAGIIGRDYGQFFKLMADIDLSCYTGTQFNIIGTRTSPFGDTFDGNGHVIRNLTFTTTESAYAYIGLFGYTLRATIQDLRVENVYLAAPSGSYVGGLTGWKEGGLVKNCSISGTINGGARGNGGLVGHNLGAVTNCHADVSLSGADCVGGLIGVNSRDGVIQRCYATGSVSGTRYIGGLVAQNAGGQVVESWASGSVSGITYIGGLVGSSSSQGSINGCYSTGMVSGVTVNVGGLVGYNDNATVMNSYNSGTVSGAAYAGGLVGSNYAGSVIHCYETGLVTGSFSGALIGYNNNGSLTACIANIETCGQPRGVGDGSSTGVLGYTTAQMQMLETYTNAGWDFFIETVNGIEDVWFVREGVHYPKLWWEHHKPVADANNVTVYAWVDGYADATLDGEGSQDADGDALEYGWYNDANELIATGAEPNVVFGVGEYIIHLVVNDGIEASEPDDCVVTVIGPAQTQAKVQAGMVNPKNKNLRIKGRLAFAGEQMPELDAQQPMLLLIGALEIESRQQTLVWSAEDLKWYLTAEFEIHSAQLAAGETPVTFVSRYISGQWVYGSDTLKILTKLR